MGEGIFSKAWTELWKEGELPVTLHHENITVGALGWLKSVEKKRKGYFLVEYSMVFYLLGDKNDSADTIMLNFWNIVEWVSKEPEKFGLTKEEEVRTLRCIEKIESEKDEEKRYAMMVQLIHAYLNDDDLIYIINGLIAKGYIKPPAVRGLY